MPSSQLKKTESLPAALSRRLGGGG